MTEDFVLKHYDVNFWQEICNDFFDTFNEKNIVDIQINTLEESFYKSIIFNNIEINKREKNDFLSFVNESRCIYQFAVMASAPKRQLLAKTIFQNHCVDGGYNQAHGSRFLSIYGSWLAIMAYQCLGIGLLEQQKLLKALKTFLTSSGGCLNQYGEKEASASANYGMIDLLLFFDEEVPINLLEWLKNNHLSDGGYRAMRKIQIADIETTYYTMRALKKAGKLITLKKDKKFLQSLRSDNFLYKNHQYAEPSYQATFYAYCLQNLIK